MHVRIMKRHLGLLIGVLVMHIMNHIHRIGIHIRKPRPVDIEQFHNLVIFQILALVWLMFRSHLHIMLLVFSSVERHQKHLGQVRPCAEELHLFSDSHC